MRNLLILLLVLGMATAANATLRISVNGDREPVDTQITIGPSDELILDIWTDAVIDKDDYLTWFNGWALVTDTAMATISGGADQTGIPGMVIYDGAAGSGFPGLHQGDQSEDGVWGASTPSGSSIPAGTVIYDGILFHCETDRGDAVIRLLSTVDWVSASLEDQVVIHQTPEPMTMALLGLGGLGLLRRRRR